MSTGPLNGYICLDLTSDLGFFCGRILADLGIEVIKVEKPGGDPARNFPPYHHDQVDVEKSLYWFSYNANKRSITLNLESDEGQQLFTDLVKKAHFIIESFPPGYMAKLNLDYASLSKINPGIIMTSITPFGQYGPYAHYKASDISIDALGAMLISYGDPDRAPTRTRIPQAQMHAGLHAAEGTLIAHYYRQLTGEGQYIDVSAMESVIWATHIDFGFWGTSKMSPRRLGGNSIQSGLKTPQIWKCKDGWICYYLRGSIYGADSNRRLTRWMASENMAPDFLINKEWEEWDWLSTSQAQLDEIINAFSSFFLAHTKDEIQEGSIERNIMIHKVCDSADAVNNIQLKDRDYWVKVHHSDLNEFVVYPGPIAKFSLTPLTDWSRAPHIGEHNQEVFGERLGLDSKTLKKLKAKRII